jgi:hypothetical protein
MPEITASAMGSPSPHPAGLGGGYKYRRDPAWTPGDPRYREPGQPRPGQEKRMIPREHRILRYCALRDSRKTLAEARAVMGIAASTARDYEREYRRRKEGQP